MISNILKAVGVEPSSSYEGEGNSSSYRDGSSSHHDAGRPPPFVGSRHGKQHYHEDSRADGRTSPADSHATFGENGNHGGNNGGNGIGLPGLAFSGGIGANLGANLGGGLAGWIGGFQEAYFESKGGNKPPGGGRAYYANFRDGSTAGTPVGTPLGGSTSGPGTLSNASLSTAGATSDDTSVITLTTLGNASARHPSSHSAGAMAASTTRNALNNHHHHHHHAPSHSKAPLEMKIYQGRRMVPDIQHLYEVVDDKEAYLNYDSWMMSASNQSSHQHYQQHQHQQHHHHRGGGSWEEEEVHRSSRNSIKNGTSKTVVMVEEELVDRMLSQFPEFGTNRPTPFTALENDDEDPQEYDGDAGAGGTTIGGTKTNTGSIASGAIGERGTVDGRGQPKTLSDEASDIIGRFFFGMPPPAAASGEGSVAGSGANVPGGSISSSNNNNSIGGSGNVLGGTIGGTSRVKGHGIISSTSFGSTSSLSSMASGTSSSHKGGRAGVVNGELRGTHDFANATAAAVSAAAGKRGDHSSIASGGVGSIRSRKDRAVEADYGPGWDQDEIDLWTPMPPAMEAPIPRMILSSNKPRKTPVSTPQPPKEIEERPVLQSPHRTDVTPGDDSKDDSSLGSVSTTDKGGPEDWNTRRRRMLARRQKMKRRRWDGADDAESGETSAAKTQITQSTTTATTSATQKSNREFPIDERLSDQAPPSLDMSDVSDITRNKELANRIGGKPSKVPNNQPTITTTTTREMVQNRNTSKASSSSSYPERSVPSKPREAPLQDRSMLIGGAVIVDDGKQHWMPDNLCKTCYSCEAPFTVFRRRHHCRLCGQIFCSACSAYFVQITSSGETGKEGSTKGTGGGGGGGKGYGTMRSCKMCYDHISERGLGVMIRGMEVKNTQPDTADPSNKSPGAGEVLENNIKGIPSQQPFPKNNARDILLPLTATKSDGDNPPVASEVTEQFTGFQGAGSTSGDFHALSITKQRLDEERRKREEQERAEAEAQQAEKAEAEGQGPFRLKNRLTFTKPRSIKWRTSTNADGKEEKAAETIEAGSNAVEVSVGGEEEKSHPNQDHQSTLLPTSLPEKTEEVSAAATIESHSAIQHVQSCVQTKKAAVSAKIHLGMIAADYLEKLGRELLQTDAPLLLNEIMEAARGSSEIETKLTDIWVDMLMTLATRCCATVEPDVKNGDLLDIRPYCKVKVIPGGSVDDCAYMSGVVFHKNVSHKKMARVVHNAKIMLLSGGIEYTRTENRIASLDALLEQEERYMEILVTKIFKLKPDVLLVGRSVSRKAQELLLRANIVLIQYVKPSLMNRIARQTRATVLSSTDHVMNQFGSTILGHCRRFRLVAFRDNDVWTDDDNSTKDIDDSQIIDTKNVETKQKDNVPSPKCVSTLLSQKLPNHERQAVLAARKLGQSVLDGMDAVKCGLAKRGVVKTYIMIEGCPKELGCTVVLRGASRPALKLVKRVLRFLINVAYNLKLETSYILERCCRLPPTYELPVPPCSSSSLCVNFGQPPNNRKVRPWNGGRNDPAQRSISGKITPLDHQAILITSVWMTDKTQCCPAEVKGICYYSAQDVSLGQFLRDSCFNLSLKCQNPSCKKSVIDHSLSFIHNDGLINITVEHMDNPIPTSALKKQQNDYDSSSASKQDKSSSEKDIDGPIATWTYCTKCEIVVTPLVFLSKQTWQWSFGKFLEVYFYNRDAIINAPGHRCSCQMQSKSVLYFGCGSLAARFTYEKVAPYSVFCRRHLPFDESFHRSHSLRDLDHISFTSSELFLRFGKQIEVISRETRDLFGSALNKPEHLQAVLSELNLVSAEVENASKVFQEKISSVSIKYSKTDVGKKGDLKAEFNEALFNFPWYSRRYLFMLTSAWNERLSAAGQAVSAMKKIQYAGGPGRADTTVVPAIVGDASTEDVIEGMKRIRQLQEIYSRNYNVRNMTMQRNQRGGGGLFEGNILPDGRVASLDQEAEMDDEEFYSDPDNDIDFEDDIDADVLASRNRAYLSPTSSSSKKSSRQRPKKHLGSRRQSDSAEDSNPLQSSPIILDQSPLAFGSSYDSSSLELQGKSKTVTAGGAVKSALNRFFNRGTNKEDPYVVDLGFIAKGRLRLQPGVGGLVIPVFDDQPSTIIAHSLASLDYDAQFKQFTSGSHSEAKSGDSSDVYPGDNGSSGTSQGRHERHARRAKSNTTSLAEDRKDIERRMLGRNKTHIKHTFRDFDEKGQQLCKFVCTTFWSVQFSAVRHAFMNPQILSNSKDSSHNDSASGSAPTTKFDIEKSYIRSLAASFAWAASGGKSGASFSRTTDDRFVIKCISRTELQMFLDCAPAYFEYLSKAFFHGLPTVLCKIVGVYQIGYHNRVTGKRTMDQVAVMQNIFFGRKISKIFDLKGSLRGRFTRQGTAEKEKKVHESKRDRNVSTKSPSRGRSKSSHSSDSDSSSSDSEDDDHSASTSSSGSDDDSKSQRFSRKDSGSHKATGDAEKGDKAEETSIPTLLDGDFLEFTTGRPLPLTDRAKAVFHMSILNDTLFLSIINVLDYSILLGIDEEKMELVVGIIDFMRQYDILKQMERVGKSLPMVVGQEAPTIIQPPLYKARFTNAMERYFMTVPSKWTTI